MTNLEKNKSPQQTGEEAKPNNHTKQLNILNSAHHMLYDNEKNIMNGTLNNNKKNGIDRDSEAIIKKQKAADNDEDSIELVPEKCTFIENSGIRPKKKKNNSNSSLLTLLTLDEDEEKPSSTHSRREVFIASRSQSIVDFSPAQIDKQVDSRCREEFDQSCPSLPSYVSLNDELPNCDDIRKLDHKDLHAISKGIASRTSMVNMFASRRTSCPTDDSLKKLAKAHMEIPDHSELHYKDLLDEGQDYVSMSMLIYIYAQLREMSLLGYTELKFDSVDVNRPTKPNVIREEGSPVRMLDNTRTAGSIIRVVLEELQHHREENEHDANDSKDIDEDIKMKNHDISIISEFNHWVEDSRVDKPDDAAEIAIKELKKRVAQAHWRRLRAIVKVNARLKTLGGMVKSTDNAYSEQVRTSCSASKKSLSEKLADRKKTLIQENTKTGSQNNWFALQRRMIEDHFGVDADKTNRGTKQDNDTEDGKPNNYMIEKTLEDSLPQYFKKGSLLSRMMDQGIEVVYFGDRHPNEATYCIAVNRATTTVTVIFRGSVSAHNWAHNFKFIGTERCNPLAKEEYEGRSDNFMVHTGFGLYLLRRRQDNQKRKLDEIFDRVHRVGLEMNSSGNYKVAITGHSLGGALATILSFYAASDNRFTNVAPVRTFTFAAPRVGDTRFLNAYCQLERTGRLMHARFFNTYDIVPLLPPFALDGWKIGPTYKHVGLQVRIHETNFMSKAVYRNALDITYPAHNKWCQVFWQVVSNSILTNLTWLKKLGRNHNLSEHQRRIVFMEQYRRCLAQTEFRHDDRRNTMKSLEQYYRIKASIPAPAETCGKPRTGMAIRLLLLSMLVIVGFVVKSLILYQVLQMPVYNQTIDAVSTVCSRVQRVSIDSFNTIANKSNSMSCGSIGDNFVTGEDQEQQKVDAPVFGVDANEVETEIYEDAAIEVEVDELSEDNKLPSVKTVSSVYEEEERTALGNDEQFDEVSVDESVGTSRDEEPDEDDKDKEGSPIDEETEVPPIVQQTEGDEEPADSPVVENEKDKEGSPIDEETDGLSMVQRSDQQEEEIFVDIPHPDEVSWGIVDSKKLAIARAEFRSTELKLKVHEAFNATRTSLKQHSSLSQDLLSDLDVRKDSLDSTYNAFEKGTTNGGERVNNPKTVLPRLLGHVFSFGSN